MATATQGQAASRGRVQIIRSSLPYQILLYINGWYFAFFFVAEILLFAFKGETLPFASNVLAAEVILLFILAGIEALRLFFALFGALYLTLWQTYVLRVDIVLAAIQLAFICLELVFGIISVVTFGRASPY